MPERKTGLYSPNVETTQLVRDERGWLRLGGPSQRIVVPSAHRVEGARQARRRVDVPAYVVGIDERVESGQFDTRDRRLEIERAGGNELCSIRRFPSS
jgi:hypothetical protein